MSLNAAIPLQRGIAMIEVLITAVILAIGLLGMGALQLTAIQATNDSSQQSQAVWAVQDFAGRILSNLEGAQASQYIVPDATISCATPPANWCEDDGDASTATPSCNAAQLATFDKWNMVCSQADTTTYNKTNPIDFLVDPTLTSACNAVDGTTGNCLNYTVTLSWTAQDENSQVNSFSTTVEVP